MARYTVERALWDAEDNATDALLIFETDEYVEAIAAADRDHAADPMGQTVVYDGTTIIYEAKG